MQQRRKHVLDMIPAWPLVEFAVRELVASRRRSVDLDIAAGAGHGGRDGLRIRAGPDPGVVRISLHVARYVSEHFLVVLELVLRSADAQALHQLVEEEAEVAAAGHVVAAQISHCGRDLEQGQGGSVFGAESEDKDAAPDVGAEEGRSHCAQARGPAPHVCWVERSLYIGSRVLRNRNQAVESVAAFCTPAGRREIVTIEKEARGL